MSVLNLKSRVIKLKKDKGFNLISVILIVLISSVVSAITTGVIVTNNYKSSNGISYNDVLNDDDLKEFLNVYSSVGTNYYEDVDKNIFKSSENVNLNTCLGYIDDEKHSFLEKYK